MSIFFPPHQEYVLILMMLTGVVIGVLFDIFEIKRRMSLNSRLVIYFDDILFTFFSAVIFIISVFVFNNGILRWYEFIFCLLGFVLYKLTLSRLLLTVFGFIADNIKKAFMLIFNFILVVFKRIFIVFLIILAFLLKLLNPLILKLCLVFSLNILINQINKMVRK